MTTWQYRLAEVPYEPLDSYDPPDREVLYSVVEVYLDDDGEIWAWAPATVDNFETVDGIRGTLEAMRRCTDYPPVPAAVLADPPGRAPGLIGRQPPLTVERRAP